MTLADGSSVSFVALSQITAAEHAAQLALVTASEQREHQYDVYPHRPTVEAPKLTPESYARPTEGTRA